MGGGLFWTFQVLLHCTTQELFMLWFVSFRQTNLTKKLAQGQFSYATNGDNRFLTMFLLSSREFEIWGLFVSKKKSFLLLIFSCIQHFNLQGFIYISYHISSMIYITAVEIKIWRDNRLSQNWLYSNCVGCQDSTPLACYFSLIFINV